MSPPWAWATVRNIDSRDLREHEFKGGLDGLERRLELDVDGADDDPVLGGLIVLVALLLRVGHFGGRKDQTDTPAPGPDTTEILRARFARGEITEDEYRKSLTVLDETKR